MYGFFDSDLSALDPDVARLIDFESERQARKLILIPSESQAPSAVREALGSVFQNIYAEGYPDPAQHGEPQDRLLDYEIQLAEYRRNSDLRYYKGVEYADILESLARRRAAEAFATPSVPPEGIWVNVQPLSGSPANSAIYAALVPAGSTVMGMDLLHGGHLTHGSPANRSGKLYRIISYGIDSSTERLDYDAVEWLALEHRPKMIIAGYTSYPWVPDWARFRQIADRAGAYLLADISHIAGMVAGGALPSPVGHAHVVSFTTHKSLYGPRGACLLTTDRGLAQKIDAAVFPGEQGGPHVNAIAGMAVTFRLARTAEFADLQRRVIENGRHLALALQKRGLRIPYGGTDTHMLLVDCKSVRSACGVSPDGRVGTPLMGDYAARILDLAGIVLNRNTIPGDRSAGAPSGIRLGTPWITQRGFGAEEIELLADIISGVLQATTPFAYPGRHGPVYCAKVDFDRLEKAKWDVVGLACRAGLDVDYRPSGYPHHYFLHKPTTDLGGRWDLIEIEGEQAQAFCDAALTCDVYALGAGASQPTWVLEPAGRPMARGVLQRPADEVTRFRLLLAKADEPRVAHWLRALSDGYVNLDPQDTFVRLPGPVVVRRLPHLEDVDSPILLEAEEPAAASAGCEHTKPYFIGHRGAAPPGGSLPARPAFAWDEGQAAGHRRSPLHEIHVRSGAALISEGGWELPLHYGSVRQECSAVRGAVGLFDLGHLGLIEVSGPGAQRFLDAMTTNDVSQLAVSRSHYSFLLDPEGQVLDDVWLYRLDAERYWMSVNAANTPKDLAWLAAVRGQDVRIDSERAWVRAPATDSVRIRVLGDTSQAGDLRVLLGLQGPRSLDLLLSVAERGSGRPSMLRDIKRNEIRREELAGYDLYVSRTGYTGEPLGFELFVHPAAAAALWHVLAEAGRPLGLRPAGAAARDALRVEAGFARYGRELAGPLGLNPLDAGFGPYVKLHKPFFVGKRAVVAHERERRARLVRFRFDEPRAQLLALGDVVVSRDGTVVGAVTSCAEDSEGGLTGLAYAQSTHARVGTRLGVYRAEGQAWVTRPLGELRLGDRVLLPDDITVIRRFLDRQA